ncbi:MAG TPA: acyltransferase family protein [Terracidiphilus sp.]|nr:acyltransferase family protein [Terracidiphilus sp.]
MPRREFYVDRLRSVMVALVILHHTAITYGAIGGWFWREVEPSSSPSGVLLMLFCTTNQAYFMGLFFLLAGYFTPASLERKGFTRFIGDRFLRLGVPLLAFILILGPLTAGIGNFAQADGFWPAIRWIWQHKEIINGPLWFAQALLIFSLGYCSWRAIFGSPLAERDRERTPVPASRWWLVSALGVGAAALAIRQFVPVGVNVFGLQLGYFAGYAFLFAVGIVAWRHDWLAQLNWKQARPWIITLLVAWPSLPIAIAIARALHRGGSSSAPSGLSWQALLYALWEPLVAWGLIAAWLLIFRERMNGPSAIWAWLNRRAYAVYIIHPPVLVSIALLLHGWAAPALVKFGVVGLLACALTWLIADPLVRLPGVQSVV